MASARYVCPATKRPLTSTEHGLVGDEGVLYPYVAVRNAGADPIPDFTGAGPLGAGEHVALEMYHGDTTTEMYRNFLAWLFGSFDADEEVVRRSVAARLRAVEGSRILITGCGLGEDISAVRSLIGPRGEIYAQDLSPSMVLGAQRRLLDVSDPTTIRRTFFSIGDATHLPFDDGFFDAAYHFGGINLFSDVRAAIKEMDRVVRAGGRVVFSDEGVAPWLKATEYGKIAISNNPLWAAEAPLALLPETALDVHVGWILGNCFYVVDFEVSQTGPRMNIHLTHKGRRGGSARTRYFGQLEGVTPETKERVLKAAADAGMSLHDWLEQAIARSL
jgi:SAM-dependent methyltransferase